LNELGKCVPLLRAAPRRVPKIADWLDRLNIVRNGNGDTPGGAPGKNECRAYCA